jgi:hypothetical protein
VREHSRCSSGERSDVAAAPSTPEWVNWGPPRFVGRWSARPGKPGGDDQAVGVCERETGDTSDVKPVA